jgi:hypothetical protein
MSVKARSTCRSLPAFKDQHVNAAGVRAVPHFSWYGALCPDCDLRDTPRHVFASQLYLLVVIDEQQIWIPLEAMIGR